MPEKSASCGYRPQRTPYSRFARRSRWLKPSWTTRATKQPSCGSAPAVLPAHFHAGVSLPAWHGDHRPRAEPKNEFRTDFSAPRTELINRQFRPTAAQTRPPTPPPLRRRASVSRNYTRGRCAAARHTLTSMGPLPSRVGQALCVTPRAAADHQRGIRSVMSRDQPGLQHASLRCRGGPFRPKHWHLDNWGNDAPASTSGNRPASTDALTAIALGAAWRTGSGRGHRRSTQSRPKALGGQRASACLCARRSPHLTVP